jgi:thioredoxin-like negative regulator of GroEL
VLTAQGKAKQAIARFDDALALAPGNRAALMYKIEAQVAAKRCKDARKTFAELAKQLDWDAKKALSANDEELPRALVKGRGFLKPACK